MVLPILPFTRDSFCRYVWAGLRTERESRRRSLAETQSSKLLASDPLTVGFCALSPAPNPSRKPSPI